MRMITLSSYSKKDNIIFRKIHGSYFLIDITDNYANDKCSLFEVNEIGSFLWNEMSSNFTVEEITHKLQNAIIDEIDYETLFQDVNEFTFSLLCKGFIEVT